MWAVTHNGWLIFVEVKTFQSNQAAITKALTGIQFKNSMKADATNVLFSVIQWTTTIQNVISDALHSCNGELATRHWKGCEFDGKSHIKTSFNEKEGSFRWEASCFVSNDKKVGREQALQFKNLQAHLQHVIWKETLRCSQCDLQSLYYRDHGCVLQDQESSWRELLNLPNHYLELLWTEDYKPIRFWKSDHLPCLKAYYFSI